MATLGARLDGVSPGEVVISIPNRADLAQQHGYLHAGVIAAIGDSACGCAALTLMEPGAAVLSVEFKLNLLAPAGGDHFTATGHVIRAGRTLTVCSAEIRATGGDPDKLVAVMQATMISVHNRAGTRN